MSKTEKWAGWLAGPDNFIVDGSTREKFAWSRKRFPRYNWMAFFHLQSLIDGEASLEDMGSNSKTIRSL